MFSDKLRIIINGFFTLMRRQHGIGLIDILAALAILGAVVSVFLTSLSSGTDTSERLEEATVAEKLVRNQLEEIKNSSYDETVPYEYTVVEHPATYSISVDVVANGDNTLQDITITVSNYEQTVLTLDTIKVKGT